MNQSDIRGLGHHWWTRADIDILRHEFLLSTIASSAATLPIASSGRILLLSCLHLLVPALFKFSSIKEQLRRRGEEKEFSHHAAFLFFLA